MKCAFVGAGSVAEDYAAGLSESPLELTAVCDLDVDRAARLAATTGAVPYADLQELLDNETVPLLVNLTSHGAHAAVTKQCLMDDRHVFSEKPLAFDVEAAQALLETAEQRELALGCAPINHRGGAQRHAESLLGDGRLGTVRLGYVHAHVGRVTEWHDDPGSFLEAGPLYDGAVYPLTLLVAWFGRIERVRIADALDVWPTRTSRSPDRASHVEATIEFATGLVVRLTASLYAPHRSREFNSLELHGDGGSLYLADSGALDTETDTVSVGGSGRTYVAAPCQFTRREQRYLDGPERLAVAIERGRRPTTGGRRGRHIVAVCNAIEAAASSGEPVSVADHPVSSRTPRPPPVRPVADDRSVLDGSERTAGIRLPPIGFGCSRYRDGEYVDRRNSITTALDAGYRLFDSAELYGNEARIGELLAAPGAPDRSGLVLVSKVWNTNHGHVAEACEGSLDALGVESLDCYMIHWPTAWAYQGPLRNLATKPPTEQEAMAFPTDDDGQPETVDVSLTRTWRRMERLHDRGLVRTLGVCNVSVEQLTTIVGSARVLPAVVQIESHPYRPRTELVRACHQRGIRVMAHSPLSAPGLLSDPILTSIAERHGRSPAAVVLAWNVQRSVVPIPASIDRDHIVANLAAARLELTPEDCERIATLEDPEFDRSP
ncbi:aldo/keto reductase [Halocatena salina]|uniref:Aldo/keto reductase n=1 Tax=Halocatena salina TaxID=2934340 RepID=A0A8U0A0Z9_9EURY|nr:aldo/keto reductase [Halocatena salina]UPM42744.1 aldo/keto reductase [Halocatena salina]